MLNKKQGLVEIGAINLMLLLLIGAGGWLWPRLASAGATKDVFSYGSGEIEVFIFSDYFCPPCQKVEPYVEKALTELFQAGVRVTLVDLPIDRRTPLYSRYFLYAANNADSFDELVRIRRVMFDVARTRAIATESELIGMLKENDVRLKLFDIRPVFEKWTELIGRFEVRSTPTCIVTRPGQEIDKFTGNRGIPEGLDRLLKEIAGGE